MAMHWKVKQLKCNIIQITDSLKEVFDSFRLN